jgi:hypothetical protein
VFNLLEEIKRGRNGMTDLYAKLLVRELFRAEPRLKRQFRFFCEEWMKEEEARITK